MSILSYFCTRYVSLIRQASDSSLVSIRSTSLSVFPSLGLLSERLFRSVHFFVFGLTTEWAAAICWILHKKDTFIAIHKILLSLRSLTKSFPDFLSEALRDWEPGLEVGTSMWTIDLKLKMKTQRAHATTSIFLERKDSTRLNSQGSLFVCQLCHF